MTRNRETIRDELLDAIDTFEHSEILSAQSVDLREKYNRGIKASRVDWLGRVAGMRASLIDANERQAMMRVYAAELILMAAIVVRKTKADDFEPGRYALAFEPGRFALLAYEIANIVDKDDALYTAAAALLETPEKPVDLGAFLTALPVDLTGAESAI